jgi:hypothetical protein
MRPWIIAIGVALALPCCAWAQEAAAPTTPVPEVTWNTGAQPDFIRAVGFSENTPDTPVKPRNKRPDLGPVYAWKGTSLWLVVKVDHAPSPYTQLCAEWPKPDPDAPPLRECEPLPEGSGRLLFAAPDNRGWPEDRYVVRLLALSECPPGMHCHLPSPDLGTVAYAVGDKPPAAANGHNPKNGGHGTLAFRWPPPRPSVRTVLDRVATFAGAVSLGEVDDRLSGALRAAGYESPAYYSAPGGYAMVARLEQIEADGTPKPVPMRWSAALPQREVFNLGDYLKALFSAPEGNYRVIVFVVSDAPFATTEDVATREEAAAWLHGGLNVLPAAIAQRPLNAQYACTALIYQFRKLGFQGEPVSVMDGAPGASLQLQRTGILDQNGRLRR